MSKAEKFIRNKTRTRVNDITRNFPWVTTEEAIEAIKIAREEIYKWLLANADDYCFCANNFEARRCIHDIKQAMKDE